MSKFLVKNNVRKIMVALVIIVLFNFIVPMYSVKAFSLNNVLTSPIAGFVGLVGDAAMRLLQEVMIGNGEDVYISKDEVEGKGLNPVEGNATIEMKESEIVGDYNIPNFKYGLEEIFSGKVAALDINFIQNPDVTKLGGQDKSSAYVLRPIIAKWYVAIRNLSIVALLSVLVYIGIRIIISSTAASKAKYKKAMLDWLVALCLVFILHFIMSATLSITEAITDMIGGTIRGININFDGNPVCATDLTGAARIQMEYEDWTKKIGYTAIYFAMVFFTVRFTFVYLKRLLYMTFLTLIAPLIAITYPIDKFSDGKAQAFNMWIKEYIFNALLQPLHLLLYIILIGTAMDLASSNLIYTLAALFFMIPAEDFLRKMFGFNKSETASTLGGFAGGALTSQLINKLGNKGKGALSGAKGSGNSKQNDKISYTGPKGMDGLGKLPGTASSANQDSEKKSEFKEDLTEQEKLDKERMEMNRDNMRNQAKEAETEEERQLYNNTADDLDKDLDKYRNDKVDSQVNEDEKTEDKPNGSNKKGGVMNGVKNVAKSKMRAFGRKGTREKIRALAKIPMAITRPAMLGAGALMGAVAAGASGKGLDGIIKGAAGGAAAGWYGNKKIVQGLTDAPFNLFDKAYNSEIGQTFREGYHGNADEANRQAYKKEFMKNEENGKWAESTFNKNGELSAKEVKQKMEEAAEISSYGITDKSEIKGIMDLESKESLTREQAMTIHRQSKNYSYNDLIDSKKRSNIVNDYTRRYKKEGLDDKEASEEARKLVDIIQRYKES